jgi:tryptophan synthase alpha chain
MSTVSAAFAKAKAENRAALVGYLPAGFPDKETGIAAAVAMARSGVDVIELGLPYSDPLIDGPVIAEAVHRSLRGGTRIRDVFDTVEAISSAGTAVLVMTYWNPVDHYGVDTFARDLKNAGGAGLITPDLTPEESGDWPEVSEKYDLDRVYLVAPSSPPERIEKITGLCRGFVYAASLMGVTGARDSVSSLAEGLVARTRAHTDLPVAVGLGVSTPEHAAQVAGFADGVIVGTALVRAAGTADPVQAGATLTQALAAGVRRQ